METLAHDTFTEVGNGLQRRRVDDFIQNFGSYLTDEYKPDEDPALCDGELRKRLIENRKTGKKRLDEVVEKFAQKQEQSGDNEDDDDDDDDEDDDVEPSESSESDIENTDRATSDAGDRVPSVSSESDIENTDRATSDAGDRVPKNKMSLFYGSLCSMRVMARNSEYWSASHFQ